MRITVMGSLADRTWWWKEFELAGTTTDTSRLEVGRGGEVVKSDPGRNSSGKPLEST